MWTQILRRLANIFKAKAHKAVDELENQVEMSKLAVAELEKAISDAAEAFSLALANHKKWDRELQQATLSTVYVNFQTLDSRVDQVVFYLNSYEQQDFETIPYANIRVMQQTLWRWKSWPASKYR